MSMFSKTLELGGIGFLVKSERGFFLSKRCEAFVKELRQVDVTIRLRQGTVDTAGSNPVHTGSTFVVVCWGEQLVTVRYANECKDELIWWMYATG